MYSTKNTHFGHLTRICMMYSVKYTQSILLTLIRVEYDANYTIYSFDHEQHDVRYQIYTLSWFNQDQNVVRHQKCNILNWPWSKWVATSNTTMYMSGSSGQVLGSMPTEQIGTVVKFSRLNERIVYVCVSASLINEPFQDAPFGTVDGNQYWGYINGLLIE